MIYLIKKKKIAINQIEKEIKNLLKKMDSIGLNTFGIFFIVEEIILKLVIFMIFE